jgi:hypothetical protein
VTGSACLCLHTEPGALNETPPAESTESESHSASAGRPHRPWQQRSRRLAPAPPHRGRRAQPVPPRPSPDLIEGLTQQQRDGSSREATPAGVVGSRWPSPLAAACGHDESVPRRCAPRCCWLRILRWRGGAGGRGHRQGADAGGRARGGGYVGAMPYGASLSAGHCWRGGREVAVAAAAQRELSL